jgi:NADH-quinone oxidoreductase subunit E
MTFSPELEERFAKMLTSYPAGTHALGRGSDADVRAGRNGAITPELIEEVAKRCGVEPLQVDEVVGYYSMLHRKPLGKYHVQVCTNISCLLVGGEELYEHAKKARDRQQGSNLRTASFRSKKWSAWARAPGRRRSKSITIFITT